MHQHLAIFAFAILAAASPSQQRQIIAPGGASGGASFSPGVMVGDFLYTAGAVGTRDGKLVDGIEAQVRQTLENLEAVLAEADMDFSRVVRASVFLTDARNFAKMNEVYRSYFSEAPPTRATVEADLAVADALVEIELVAVRKGVDRKVIEPEDLAVPPLPFSWGIEAGNTVFVAGATSRNPEDFSPVGGDIKTQVRRVLGNIGSVLKAAKLGYGDVVECSVFLADPREFAAMNEVYRTYFTEAPPARATVRARLMNPIHKLEIQCIATRGERRVVSTTATGGRSPLSPAIATADRLHLSGFTGRGRDGYAPGDVRAQTEQAMARLKATLAVDGLDFSDVVSARIFLTDARDFAAVNAIYRRLVPGPRPARTTIGTPLMNARALVEIQMLARRR